MSGGVLCIDVGGSQKRRVKWVLVHLRDSLESALKS